MDNDVLDRIAIRQLVDNWVLWRDAGMWEQFRT
ncbi:MAG: nuclear transport factor 2 family protein, partial [Beijerinckiaceae bacterium]|nr:nuclear transport factor 2 family protein [Beijerinckiaceae bacterium]